MRPVIAIIARGTSLFVNPTEAVPDDDGHLGESFQNYAKRSQHGTVRLDSGM